jgi:capsular exopolysaccharide synthesis family protein
VVLVKELETPEKGTRPDARVVVEQRATVPSTPVTPRPLRNITFGLALGLIAGVGAAVARDLLDNTVKDRETLEDITGVGVVGNIPLDKERRRVPAISFGSDSTTVAEAFRKLRTNLKFLAVDNPPRAFVVTSSTPNEGKSTTAINIALALAEAEHKVVLVDGDMRRPSLDKYLNVVGQVGFSSVLSGATTLDEALQETGFEGLTVLSSGTVPPNPSELLGSMTAQKIISDLRARFDYVVIDGAPLLAVTDSAILATHTDGALLIAKFGSTKRDQLSHAVRALQDVGATILGAIFSMVPVSRNSAYGYQYEYYGKRARD